MQILFPLLLIENKRQCARRKATADMMSPGIFSVAPNENSFSPSNQCREIPSSFVLKLKAQDSVIHGDSEAKRKQPIKS